MEDQVYKDDGHTYQFGHLFHFLLIFYSKLRMPVKLAASEGLKLKKITRLSIKEVRYPTAKELCSTYLQSFETQFSVLFQFF